ncbi:MAG: DNA replication and repair protein RecF [Verrucomicrobia bacterium]|nr:DNA replication and repair protein RecF [Verrucomicrobiota bacterium]MBV9658100.1 DNA replication and repair protein RecF [Verrucomicrobiota bacterium]
MLLRLELRDFRCFPFLRVEITPGAQFFVGPNAQGKTSILEAACVLLRLASPRAGSTLAPLVRWNAPSGGFALAGSYGGRELRFLYSPERKKLELDAVEQSRANEYLRLARLVYLGNSDLELVRGSGETRRRFLDFLGAQIEPLYRVNLRAYERALRSRNRLLKTAPDRRREIAAYDVPLVEAGTLLTSLRRSLVAELTPWAVGAQTAISAGDDPTLGLRYESGIRGDNNGGAEDFTAALHASRAEETRLRQTLVGPHRDDLCLTLADRAAAEFASEGQQRTVALALKLAQASLLEAVWKTPPLLLFDDIFGELDPARRNALLAALPAGAQQLITTTHLDWLDAPPAGPVWELTDESRLRLRFSGG